MEDDLTERFETMERRMQALDLVLRVIEPCLRPPTLTQETVLREAMAEWRRVGPPFGNIRR